MATKEITFRVFLACRMDECQSCPVYLAPQGAGREECTCSCHQDDAVLREEQRRKFGTVVQ